MDEYIWAEKYRPKSIAETILPPSIKKPLQATVDSGEIQHMIFYGTSGLGKTTAAMAICDELNLDYILINGSDEGNIDTLRGKIKNFASTISLTGGMSESSRFKVVIIDEADGLNPTSFQPALRNFMDTFSSNCRFILTCNYKEKLINPLHGRCANFDFNTDKKTMQRLAAKFHVRVKDILKLENVEYDEHYLADVIMKNAPDWRSILNEVQRSSITGQFNSETASVLPSSYKDLFNIFKDRNFKKMRQWVANNTSIPPSSIFRGIYDEMEDSVKDTSMPQLVLILADYQYKSSFVADQELNLAACFTEIMSGVEFD